MKLEKLDRELLTALVQGGYLQGMPLHDRRDPDSWSVFYQTSTTLGVGCRVHGEWDGQRFVTSAAPRPESSATGPDRAFALERAATDSKYEPTERLVLSGPVSATALGIDAATAEVSIDELATIARAGGPRARSVVALALRRMRHKRGLPILRGLLADPDEYVRKQASWALGQIGSPLDVPALTKLLSDPAERVRDFAAYALARLGDEAGVRASTAALRDGARNPIRRGEAAIAMADGPGRLRNGPYNADPIAWDKIPKSRAAELTQRVRAVIDDVLMAKPHPDLEERCRQALARLGS